MTPKRRRVGQVIAVLPMLLGAIGALLFIIFLLSFYEDLFVKSWMAEARYVLIVSHVVPYLELSVLSFAGSFALLHPNRNRLIFGALGAAVTSYGILNTKQYASLNASTWQGWAQALFIQIVVPLSLGLLMIVAIPFVEEASRMEKTLSGLTLNLPKALEEIGANLEKLSRRLDELSSIRYPREDLASLREQVHSLDEQIRGLKADVEKLFSSPTFTAERTLFQGVRAIGLKPLKGLRKISGGRTQVSVQSSQSPEPLPLPAPQPPRIDLSKPGLPDCAKDNPWTDILVARKTEVRKPS